METPLTKAAAAKPALYASRFNTMFSIGMLYCMVAQQNAQLFSADGKTINMHQPAVVNALTLMQTLYREGHVRPNLDYAAANQAFLNGEAGVVVVGTWTIDQFLRDGANQRTDAYGGSIENRCRFALEVVDAVVAEIGAGRVGIRLSPVTPANDLSDSDPQALFGHLVEQLDQRGIAFLHVVEGATGGPRDLPGFDYAGARQAFKGAYIANNGYDREMAIEAVESGRADAVAFGRQYIANPDLVQRLKQGAALNQPVLGHRQGDITIGATLTPGAAYYISDTPGGIWTPASAMGTKLIQRLAANAGLSFAVEQE